MKFTREFFNCDCFTEGVILDSEDDMPYNIYLAFWEYGGRGNSRLPLSERIRWCWNIMLKGLPWTDAVTMNSFEAQALGKAILKRVKKNGKLFRAHMKKHKAEVAKNKKALKRKKK